MRSGVRFRPRLNLYKTLGALFRPFVTAKHPPSFGEKVSLGSLCRLC